MVKIEIIITKEQGGAEDAYYYKLHAKAQFASEEWVAEYETNAHNEKFSGLKSVLVAAAGRVAENVVEKLLEKQGYKSIVEKF